MLLLGGWLEHQACRIATCGSAQDGDIDRIWWAEDPKPTSEVLRGFGLSSYRLYSCVVTAHACLGLYSGTMEKNMKTTIMGDIGIID